MWIWRREAEWEMLVHQPVSPRAPRLRTSASFVVSRKSEGRQPTTDAGRVGTRPLLTTSKPSGGAGCLARPPLALWSEVGSVGRAF